MQRIVYLERESIRAEVRRPAFAHEWTEYARTTAAQLEERLAGASIASVQATPESGKQRSFDVKRDSRLSPVPGLPGVLR